MRRPSTSRTVCSLTNRRAHARFAAVLLLALVGCARSAIEYQEDDDFSQREAGDPGDAWQDVEDGGEDPADGAVPIDPSSGDDGSAPRDANASGGTDASSNPARDAGSSSAQDASMNTPQDASMSTPQDAASSADASGNAPADAGASAATDASGAPVDAAPRDAATGGSCNANSCNNDCSISGPFRCCTLLDTCGCSWAPGAYCL
jgi:hypothetical protein